MSTQPIVKGNEMRIMVVLRPSVSMRKPALRAPTRAPSVSKEDTHVQSSALTLKSFPSKWVLFFNCGATGDDQPRHKPSVNDPSAPRQPMTTNHCQKFSKLPIEIGMN